jgi:hypothetical protein
MLMNAVKYSITQRSERRTTTLVFMAIFICIIPVSVWSVPPPTPLVELPRYYPSRVIMLDFRDSDLSHLNLAGREFDLFHSMFSTRTVWPEELPMSFRPEVLIEIAKIRSPKITDLHNMGFTGRGITIALVDGPARITHQEFGGRIKSQPTNHGIFPDGVSYHGTLMAGIAIGQSVGIAPEANLRVYSRGWSRSSYQTANSILQIIEDNENATPTERVRSICHAGIDNPEFDSYEDLQAAIVLAEQAGISYLDPWLFERNPKYLYYGLEREPYSDPDDFDSYRPVGWADWMVKIRKCPFWQDKYTEIFQSEDTPVLLFPVDPVTFAGWIEDDQYIYKFISGWSQFPAYLAGLYSIALQKRDDLAFDQFWDILIQTGVQRYFQTNGKTVDGRIINPVVALRAQGRG